MASVLKSIGGSDASLYETPPDQDLPGAERDRLGVRLGRRTCGNRQHSMQRQIQPDGCGHSHEESRLHSQGEGPGQEGFREAVPPSVRPEGAIHTAGDGSEEAQVRLRGTSGSVTGKTRVDDRSSSGFGGSYELGAPTWDSPMINSSCLRTTADASPPQAG